jgi:hypothetical protein
LERNDTSDRATDLGVLNAGARTVAGLSITRHANGLRDFDWFRMLVTQSGTLTVRVDDVPSPRGDLNLRVFTLGPTGSLIQLGASTATNTQTQSVTVRVSAGQPIFLWVYGADANAFATYTLNLGLI